MTLLDAILWWTGAFFWVAWLGLLASSFGNAIVDKLTSRAQPRKE